MINEKRIDEIKKQTEQCCCSQVIYDDETDEIISLARDGLFARSLIEKENGKANLLCVIAHGKWAMQHADNALYTIAAMTTQGVGSNRLIRDISVNALQNRPKGFGEQR